MGEPFLLLIEENEDDVYLTLRELRRFELHMRVRVLRDSEEALEFLLHCRRLPSAILLGLKFVHLSGVELLAELRSRERTRDLPVVMLAAGREERERVGREVADSFPVACIEKPLQVGPLTAVLSKLGIRTSPAFAR